MVGIMLKRNAAFFESRLVASIYIDKRLRIAVEKRKGTTLNLNHKPMPTLDGMIERQEVDIKLVDISCTKRLRNRTYTTDCKV